MNRYQKGCGCTDKKQVGKTLYWDEWAAKEQIRIAMKDRQVNLKLYRCPSGRGFHLTSNA